MEDYSVWEDINGEEHKIIEMTDKYIINCIIFLARNHQELLDQYKQITDRNGNITEKFLEQYDWYNENCNEYIKVFAKELSERTSEREY